MSATYYTCAEALPVFIQERGTFSLETTYSTYRRSSYCLSHALISLPSLIFLALSFAALTFWAVGLDGGASGFCSTFVSSWRPSGRGIHSSHSSPASSLMS
ncbi:ABC transporter G member 6 [Datura stramonium]|uniref:ABC transporter G member 6 n=1 Tax=Datura stramonium TaxID=4076 RepID=A0ABS8SXX5_DATST|nr:ABC transporter G member 6 [Datura stramonium]